jgi:transposase
MKYNQKTINQVIEMFNSGISKTDISKKININIKTVSSWTKKEEEKNNLNLNKQIFELRNQNFSISKISEKLKINRLKVSKILDDQNSYLTLSKYKSSLKERVQELSKKGKSLEEIRLIINLNLPSSTFYRWCKNIPKSIHPFYKTKEIKNDYFSKENLDLFPERFVIVGFIAADGCISDTKNGQNILCINISKKDLNVLNIINKEICKNTRKIYKNKKNP